jgi:hypothetical protein
LNDAGGSEWVTVYRGAKQRTTKHTRFVAALLGLRHTAHLKLGVHGVGYALTLHGIVPAQLFAVIRHSKRPRVGNQNDPTPEIEKTVDQQIEFVNPESLFLPANEFRR